MDFPHSTNMDFPHSTNEEILAAWDNGGIVWTCEMGGLGPGYEQAIHIMAFEMLRAMINNPPKSWEELDAKGGGDKWDEYRDGIEKVPAVKAVIERIKPSGAQFGAAMNIASVFARNGYAKGIAMVPEKRLIQVSNHFPGAA